MDKTITVSGTVVEFDFGYPHPSLFFDVTDEKGQVVKWGAEFFRHPAALEESGMDQGDHQVQRQGRSRLPSLEIGQARLRPCQPLDQRQAR
jgi:hypothetical protein